MFAVSRFQALYRGYRQRKQAHDKKLEAILNESNKGEKKKKKTKVSLCILTFCT